MIASSLVIEKCANCGHDIMARDDLVKHTNVDQEGHRFFTKFCQECYRSGGSCDSPSVGKQVIEVGREPEVKPPETEGEDPGSIPPEDHRRQAPTEGQEALLHENEVLRQKILDLERQVSAAEETPRTIPADHAQEGRLQSRIEISCFTGYYDTQKKLISETIKEEIYHAAKGKTITMETRVLPGDARRIVVEISGMEEKEVQA